jgi:DNA repair protein RadD
VELRGYQSEVVDLVTGGKGDMLIQAPTGAGKTIIFSKCLEVFASRGQKSLVLAHRGELIRQADDKLRKATGLDCGVFSAYMGRKDIKPITVASIQSLANYKGDLDFDNIIIDEAHRLPFPGKESQYRKVLERVQARLLGFTATPYRLDSGAIYGPGQWWQNLDFQIPLRQLIEEGHLCDYVHRVASGTKRIRQQLSSVKITAGDYNEKQSAGLMCEEMNIHSIINTVGDEKSIVVFCVNIDHAEVLARAIKDTVSIVHSKMSAGERDKNLKDFDEGKTRWMLNIGVLTEGWDCTRVDALVLARPTKSTALYVQMVGRGLRLHPGKEKCNVYDIVGNYDEFGLVDDPKINEDSRGDGEAKPKVCPECFAVVAPNKPKCPECGEVFKAETDKVEDDENSEFEMREITLEEHPDYGDVTGGRAEIYESKKGTRCIKVSYYHSARKCPITHYYPIDKHWIGAKLAGIANRYNDWFCEKWLHPERYMKAVNGGHIFPMKNLRVIKDGKYEKVSTL